jgi:lysophospholipase L1-like esterase
MKAKTLVSLAAVGVLAVGAGGSSRISGQAPNARWVAAWATSQQTLGETQVTNATVRMIARVTIAGDAVRVRLDNTFGTEPLTVGRAFVGHRVRGALLARGSNRPVTFNGRPDVSVPAKGDVWSDPVALKVFAQQDLAVSLHVSGTNVRPSQHSGALVTSYRSADGSGDVSSDESDAPFKQTTTSLWWVKAIDVQSASSAGAIVAFGDSITDGTCSTLDAHDRWEDVLAFRLGEHDAMMRQSRTSASPLKAVINEGIGGNTVLREGLTPPPDSPSGLERLDRDVFSHHGVTDVVLFMGTNDIRRGATASAVIQGMTTIIQKVKAKGFKMIGATIIPRHNVAPTPTNSGWDSEKTRIRNEVNQWMRTKAGFDHVLDFDQVVRDPDNTDLIFTPFNCGDGVHPSPLGYYHMGRAIDLTIFR